MESSKDKGTASSAVFSKLIQETKAAKHIAHLNEIFLQNITRVLPQYVFWKDVKSIYLGCNKNYANLVGLNFPEEIVGKTDNDLYWQPIGHTTETFQKGDQDTIAGRPLINQEETLALPNGKILITLVSKLPIIDNGNVIGIVGYFSDITELKNKEKELIKARREAEAANEAKSTFLTNISHDIRTPLTGMIGMTKILLQNLKSQKNKKTANNLLMAENILLDLLNEVIEVSKLAFNTLPLYAIKFNLKELINELSILVTPSVEEKRLKLIIKYDKRIPKYVIGDHKRIHRILLNLVSNAIKFTPQGRIQIIVKLAKQNARNLILKIAIQDTGIGIPRADQQIIFSRFTRLEAAHKGNYKGSGLGLSIVKQFITEIEGEIYVESDEGKGSTFTCILPLKKALLDASENKNEGKKHSIKISRNQYNSLSKKTSNTFNFNKTNPNVLLVEDNALVQMVEKKLLEDMGCKVTTADTGETALALFKKNKYDIIFMDVGLPGKNGCETTQGMRILEKQNNKGPTPIIALTAHIDAENKQECLNADIDEVITKPINDETAMDILKKFLSPPNKKIYRVG